MKTSASSRPGGGSAAGNVLLIATWIGLFAGLVEAAYLACGKIAVGRMNFVPESAYWMAPVAHVAVYLVAVMPVALIARRRASGAVSTFTVTWTSALAWLALLALVPGLQLYAHLLLAVGLAAATGRVFDRFRDTAIASMRRTAPWLAAAVVLIAVGQQARNWMQSARATPATAQTAEEGPNVLLIVLDTLRADALADYGGSPEDAPFLNRLASSAGSLVFDRAYATAPWTLPSTAGMFTGRLPYDLSAGWDEPLDEAEPTIAEVLSRAGYTTAGFIANTRYCSRETGLARGFDHYEDWQFHPAHFVLSTALGRRFQTTDVAPLVGIDNDLGRISAEHINRRLLSWLADKENGPTKDAPFFAFLNYYDVHHPYTAPAPFNKHAPTDVRQRKIFLHWWWVHKEHVEDHERDQQRAAYLDCLRYLDSQLEDLFDELERRGVLDDTIVIITADHGEQFGEHGLYLHGNSLYEPLVHVPLIVLMPEPPRAYPAVRYGDGSIQREHCEVPVSLAALPSTIVELTGIHRTAGADAAGGVLAADVVEEAQGPFPYRSLMQIWRKFKDGTCATCDGYAPPVRMQVKGPPGGPLPCQGHSPVAAGEMEATITGHKKRIRHADGHEEVFDLATDPAEEHNLAGQQLE